MKAPYIYSLAVLALFATSCSTTYHTNVHHDDIYYSEDDDIAYEENDDSQENYGYDSYGHDDYETEEDYSTSSKKQDGQGNTYVTNNYYDNYDDYYYSSRIKRFHRPYSGFGYYSNCYTDFYFYNHNPHYYGTSIYIGWGYPNYYYRPYHYYRPYPYYGYYPSYGYNPYGGYGGYYSGYHHGYANGYHHGYNDGYYGYGGYNSGYYGSGYNDYKNSNVRYGARGSVSSNTPVTRGTGNSTIKSGKTDGNTLVSDVRENTRSDIRKGQVRDFNRNDEAEVLANKDVRSVDNEKTVESRGTGLQDKSIVNDRPRNYKPSGELNEDNTIRSGKEVSNQNINNDKREYSTPDRIGNKDGNINTPTKTRGETKPSRNYEAPKKENTDRNYVPDRVREYNPPKRDNTPPQRDYTPPKRENNPPQRDYTPPKRDNSPPKRDYTPPKRDNSPPQRDYSPPKRDNSPPSRNYEAPKRNNNSSPSRNYSPPSTPKKNYSTPSGRSGNSGSVSPPSRSRGSSGNNNSNSRSPRR